VIASVFVGTSLDGFIARVNGDLDFLPPGGDEPHGYDGDDGVVGDQPRRSVLSIGSREYLGEHFKPGWSRAEWRVLSVGATKRAVS